MKILIADDHAIVRRGLKQILSEEYDMQRFGEACYAHEVLEKVQQENWDVLVLDINMPGRGGLDILKEVKQIAPKLPVLILSMHSEDQFALRALKIGASGYLTKDSAPHELVGAIRKVIAGRKYVSPSLAEKLASKLHMDIDKLLHDNLSTREFQIFLLLAAGKTVGEIAKQFSLSIKTISTYRTRILEKMHMKTNAELMYYAMRNQLL